MIYKVFFWIIFFIVWGLRGQEIKSPSKKNIKKYREDQFYLGVVYNTLLGLPNEAHQNNFSYGIHAGFIRDFPLNKSCNKAIGIGVGYATNSYYSNLFGVQTESEFLYHSTPRETNNEFISNKIQTHLLEVPLEFRLRTSTYESSVFWRWYFGFKASYIFESSSQLFLSGGEKLTLHNPHINHFRYSVYIAFNFKGKWNIFIDYDLNPLLDPSKAFFNTENSSGTHTSRSINIRSLRFGIRFYIL